MRLGIVSLSDLQTDPRTGRLHPAAQRTAEIIGYAQLADTLGLDLFGLGEHHSAEFAVSSPAVVLAAVAARTSSIRLTSAVTVLSALDPVRVYQDFATLDLVSGGRAELIVGRSAFLEPFALFGIDTAHYESVFEEKLALLLRISAEERLSWSGTFRPPIVDATVAPRALQDPLPVHVGVGGSPGSAERAGRLGLPMVLGLIGGTIAQARRTVESYRAAGERAGQSSRLQVGISTHFYAAGTPAAARAVFPYYREYLRPKAPGARGFHVEQAQFEAGTRPGAALMIGSSEELVEKLLLAHELLGVDLVFGQVDWGGLPRGKVEESIARFATEVAPAVRAATGG